MLFYAIDKNNDGYISYAEFSQWIRYYLGAEQIDRSMYYIQFDDVNNF